MNWYQRRKQAKSGVSNKNVNHYLHDNNIFGISRLAGEHTARILEEHGFEIITAAALFDPNTGTINVGTQPVGFVEREDVEEVRQEISEKLDSLLYDGYRVEFNIHGNGMISFQLIQEQLH